jgi:hypothetical protein
MKNNEWFCWSSFLDNFVHRGVTDDMKSTIFLLNLLALVTIASAEVVRVGGQQVDYAAFLARNDVVYLGPAREGWKGMPLGNGNLGAIVWQPDKLLLQLNSAWSGVYGGAIGRLHLSSTPGLLSAAHSYQQRLSLYDASVSTSVRYAGGEFQSDMFVAADTDVLVLSVLARMSMSTAGTPIVSRPPGWASPTT